MSKCFIFGAGASYGYDDTIISLDRPPMTDDLFTKAFQKHKIPTQIFPDLINKLKEYGETHSEPLEEKQYQTNVEDVLSWLNDLSFQSQDFKTALCQVIYVIYDLLRSYSYNYKQNGNNYQKLANLYNDEKYSVISTNYDTIFETAILKSNLNFHHFPTSHNGIPIAKIHGSINWVTNFSTAISYGDISKNKIIPKITQNIISNTLKTGKLPTELPVQLLKFPLEKIAESGTNYWLPQIIPPIGKNKHSWFLEAKNEAFALAKLNLEKTDEIVAIGTQIRSEDQEFRELLKKNLNKNAKITIVNPKHKDVESNLKEIVGSEIEFNEPLSYFSDYIKMIN